MNNAVSARSAAEFSQEEILKMEETLNPSRLRSVLGFFRRRPWLSLAVLYVFGCLLRLALLGVTSPNPMILPDEMLYYNLARSINRLGRLEVNGQPYTYYSFLYSLIISPIYSLPLGTDYFALIRIFNILAMSSAIFPLYLILKSLGVPRGYALLVCAYSLLLPDFFLTSRAMNESIIFPLYLWTLLAGKRLIDEISYKRIAVFVGLSLLAIIAKEGAIAIPIAMSLVFVWRGITDRDNRQTELGTALAVICGSMLLRLLWRLFVSLAFSASLGTQTIYDLQYTSIALLPRLALTFSALFLYALFVPVGFGVMPALLPAAHMDRFEEKRRWFLRFIYTALFFFVVGICWLIFTDEVSDGINSSRVHLRYVFPFLPILLGALFSEDMEGAGLNKRLVWIFAVFAGLLVGLGLEAYADDPIHIVDSALLSTLNIQNSPVNLRKLAMAIIIFGGIITAFYLRKTSWNNTMKNVLFAILTGGLLLSNFAMYSGGQYYMSRDVHSDAIQTAVEIDGKNALLVSIWANEPLQSELNALDVSSKNAPNILTLEDYCLQLDAETLTIPAYRAAGASTEIPRPDYVVIERYYFENRLVIRGGLTGWRSDKETFYAIEVPEDGVWLHSALTGLFHGITIAEDTALWIFDEELLAEDTIRILLDVTADTAGKLTMSVGDYSETLELPKGRANYIFTIPLSGAERPARLEIRTDAEAHISTYRYAGGVAEND